MLLAPSALPRSWCLRGGLLEPDPRPLHATSTPLPFQLPFPFHFLSTSLLTPFPFPLHFHSIFHSRFLSFSHSHPIPISCPFPYPSPCLFLFPFPFPFPPPSHSHSLSISHSCFHCIPISSKFPFLFPSHCHLLPIFFPISFQFPIPIPNPSPSLYPAPFSSHPHRHSHLPIHSHRPSGAAAPLFHPCFPPPCHVAPLQPLCLPQGAQLCAHCSHPTRGGFSQGQRGDFPLEVLLQVTYPQPIHVPPGVTGAGGTPRGAPETSTSTAFSISQYTLSEDVWDQNYPDTKKRKWRLIGVEWLLVCVFVLVFFFQSFLKCEHHLAPKLHQRFQSRGSFTLP